MLCSSLLWQVETAISFSMNCAWTPTEDYTLLKLIDELGYKWSKIRKAFPTRSVASIRNRWLRIDARYIQQCQQNRQEAGELDAILPDNNYDENFGLDMF